MKINIFGCRGSIARSHKDIVRYGGNTSCIEVESDNNTRIVLDMGSGAYELGQKLTKQQFQGQTGAPQHILLTASKWDHIQGFPFFAPLYEPGSQWTIYSPEGLSASLQQEHSAAAVVNGSNIKYVDLQEGNQLQLGDVTVTTQYSNHNHNLPCLGYRLECQGVSMAYVTGHEMYNRQLAMGYNRRASVNYSNSLKTQDDKHADFFAGVDLLVHDAQYLGTEYQGKKEGFGHSTVEYVVDMALAVGVTKLLLFHHDPQRTDEELDQIVAMARQRVAFKKGSLEVFAAADYSTLELRPKGMAPPMATNGNSMPMVNHQQQQQQLAMAKYQQQQQQMMLNNYGQQQQQPQMQQPQMQMQPPPMQMQQQHPPMQMQQPAPPMQPMPPPMQLNKNGTTNGKKPDFGLSPPPSTEGTCSSSESSQQHEVVITHAQKDLFSDLYLDGFTTKFIDKGRPFLQSFRFDKPGLILVRYENRGDEYIFNNAQRLRQMFGDWGRQVPYIVMVKDQQLLDQLLMRKELEGIITDWIVEPLTKAYIRNRVRVWMSRNSNSIQQNTMVPMTMPNQNTMVPMPMY